MTEFTFNVAEKVLEKLGSLAYGAGDELEKLSRTITIIGRKVKKINERIGAIVADKAKFQLVERGEERRGGGVGEDYGKMEMDELQEIDKNVLHLSIPDPNSVHPDLLTLLQGLDRVRTVFIHSAEDVIISSSILETCLSKYKYLRSLNFSRSQFEELPKQIGKLKHLRYLDLSWNHRIKRLPNSICKLQNLQTLLLGGCDEIEDLPRGMRYMESLGFLWLATRQTSLPRDEIGCLKSLWFLWISACEKLEFLFEDMENLSALRSLYISTCPSLTSLPPNMMHLTALQDLHISGCENFNFGYQAPCEFRLRKLVLCCLIVVEELPEWLIKGSAETLKNLNLEFCPVLVDLPDCLQNFSALQEIWILGCPLLGGNANKTAMIVTVPVRVASTACMRAVATPGMILSSSSST
ncbi:hypothetical protein OIU78_017251 [Salix suchowensis]|nr:hypothetical protein OIU78_017251 [Salix suchowensis]